MKKFKNLWQLKKIVDDMLILGSWAASIIDIPGDKINDQLIKNEVAWQKFLVLYQIYPKLPWGFRRLIHEIFVWPALVELLIEKYIKYKKVDKINNLQDFIHWNAIAFANIKYLQWKPCKTRVQQELAIYYVDQQHPEIKF